MWADKIAVIMSGLTPSIAGARPPKGTTAPPRAPTTTPGLGERMRTETSHALEHALVKGQTDALSHFGVKAAAVPLPHPMPAAPSAAAPHVAPTAPAQQAASPSMTSRMGAGASRFMRPMKRGLGLAALGTAGAMAYGLHEQNKEDEEARNLAYAPMQGTY